jgi:membrane protein implicated in regulation of membrane protease activity
MTENALPPAPTPRPPHAVRSGKDWLRIALWGGVFAAALFLLALAAVAFAIFGAILAGAVLAYRALNRDKAKDSRGQVLEGRRTAEGWIVEGGSR